MNHKLVRLVVVALLAFLSIGLAATLALAAQGEASIDKPSTDRGIAQATYTYTTVITVTSGTDPDTSNSTTCSSLPCTLRRAVIQARNLPDNQKPVLIAFNIPATAGEGYNSASNIWKIQFSGISTDQAALHLQSGKLGSHANGATRLHELCTTWNGQIQHAKWTIRHALQLTGCHSRFCLAILGSVPSPLRSCGGGQCATMLHRPGDPMRPDQPGIQPARRPNRVGCQPAQHEAAHHPTSGGLLAPLAANECINSPAIVM